LRKESDHQCIRRYLLQTPFHAQDSQLNSSSWVGQVPNFRQETRQSNYRNDPVKYDLARLMKQKDLIFSHEENEFDKKEIRLYEHFYLPNA